MRELALLNLAIDSKCGVATWSLSGSMMFPATAMQSNGRPCAEKDRAAGRFKLTEQTRQAIDEYLARTGKKPGEYLFNGLRPGRA